MYLYWSQEDVVDNFILYWKTEHGPEYNISTESSQTYFFLHDDRITLATWYYISLVAVAGEETSNRSDTTRIISRKFSLNTFTSSC